MQKVFTKLNDFILQAIKPSLVAFMALTISALKFLEDLMVRIKDRSEAEEFLK